MNNRSFNPAGCCCLRRLPAGSLAPENSSLGQQTVSQEYQADKHHKQTAGDEAAAELFTHKVLPVLRIIPFDRYGLVRSLIRES